MTNNMCCRFFGIHPTVPNYLMSIEPIFRDTHWIYLSTAAVIFLTTIMCIRITKNNIHTSGTHALSSSWTHFPIIVPTCYTFDCMCILIVIVSTSISYFRSVYIAVCGSSGSFFVKRRRKFVPIFT